jgi:hypothetical protein
MEEFLMRSFLTCICVVAWSSVLQAAVEGTQDEERVATLVNRLQDSSDPAASRAAFVGLSERLRGAPSATAAEIQTLLCQALRSSNDAWAIRKIAHVLSAAPCEDGVVILASRLGADQAVPMSMALCDGIRAIAARRPTLSPATVTLVLGRLEALARNGRLPGTVIDSAIMATAAFGSAGYDQLIRFKLDGTVPAKVHGVMYTALGQTDDPRAFGVLCEAAADTGTHDGRRIQAICSLGQMFSRAAASGRVIDPTERSACVKVLETYLSDTTPDQVFASALKAVARMVDPEQDATLQQTVLTALTSAGDGRREAALEVLYQHRRPLGSDVQAVVRGLAESDASPDVRSVAASVLDKEQVFQIGTLTDTK